MSKFLHPNQYKAILSDLQDPYYSFPEHFKKPLPLNPYVTKHLYGHLKRGNLKTHLKDNGVSSWDYIDKKCKYHRRDSGQGWDIAEKIFKKHVGKTYKEIKEIILKKRCRHFFEMSLLDQLKIAYTGTHDIYTFNSDNKLELKEKIITTKNEYNPYLYRKLDLSSFSNFNKSIKNDLPMLERFEKFIQMLEYNGYEVKIYELSCSFKGKGIRGYINVDSNSPSYCGLVFADYYEYFNKVSRCSLVFDIPKSKLGCDSALKELVYLGTKSAKKELYNETYQPKHVNPVNWWNR